MHRRVPSGADDDTSAFRLRCLAAAARARPAARARELLVSHLCRRSSHSQQFPVAICGGAAADGDGRGAEGKRKANTPSEAERQRGWAAEMKSQTASVRSHS